MLNQCILVGKVIGIKKDGETAVMTLSIKRNYKDQGEDEYKCDELDIQLSDHLSATALEYLNENATVGVKARLKSISKIVANTEIKMHKIIAEKLTFINTKKSEK
jgi:hypothetical protein